MQMGAQVVGVTGQIRHVVQHMAYSEMLKAVFSHLLALQVWYTAFAFNFEIGDSQ